jgi:hypothetical protein
LQDGHFTVVKATVIQTAALDRFGQKNRDILRGEPTKHTREKHRQNLHRTARVVVSVIEVLAASPAIPSSGRVTSVGGPGHPNIDDHLWPLVVNT